MALTTQPVTGTFYYADGTAMAGAYVRISLLKPDVDIETGEYIPESSVSFELDGEGSFEGSVWPNVRSSSTNNPYQIEITYSDKEVGKAVKKITGKVIIPESDSVVDVNKLGNSNTLIKSLSDSVDQINALLLELSKKVSVLENKPQVDYSSEISEINSKIKALELPKVTEKKLTGPFLNDKVAKENGVFIGEGYIKVGGKITRRAK